MLLQTLLALLGFASIFGIIAGLSKDRVYLLPMAGVLVLSASMMMFSGVVQVQNGFDITEEDIDSNTTEITERASYYQIDDNYSEFDFTTAFGIILLIISIYSMFLGADLTGTIRKS